jgi:hypothetical protein
MKKIRWALAFSLGLVFVAMAAGLVLAVELGDIKLEDLKDYYKDLGKYFNLWDKDVDKAKNLGLSDADLPTLFLISRHAGVDWARVADFRKGGKSWNEVCLHFNVSPEVFFVPLKEHPSGPPYGNAYGYYKNKDKNKWKNVKLSDDDFNNLSNLKFVSEHNGWDTDDVVKQRAGGKDFININKDVKNKAFDKDGKEKSGKDIAPGDVFDKDKPGANKGDAGKSQPKEKDADKGPDKGKDTRGDKGGGKSKGGAPGSKESGPKAKKDGAGKGNAGGGGKNKPK